MLKFPQWSSLGMANNGLLYKLNFWFYGAILKVRKLSSRWKHDTPNKAQFTLYILMVSTRQWYLFNKHIDCWLPHWCSQFGKSPCPEISCQSLVSEDFRGSFFLCCAIFLIITPCWYCQLRGLFTKPIALIQILYFVKWRGVAWLTLVEGFMKKRFVLPTIPVIIGTIVSILDQCFCTASPMCSPPHHHLLPHQSSLPGEY